MLTRTLDIASNAVVDLVRAAKLDEAEAAARDLLRRFPDVHDGWDRLGMVHEARGDSRQAADCYRKVIAFIRDHPDDYEPQPASGAGAARRGPGKSAAAGRYGSERASPREQYSADRAL